MQRSLDVSSNPDVTAETYGELAFQSALRGGMWRRLPEPELIETPPYEFDVPVVEVPQLLVEACVHLAVELRPGDLLSSAL